MVKLIVFDFDGTIKPYGENAVPEAVKERLKQSLDKGISLAVSSGRTYRELQEYLADFADSLYFICCDGSYYIKNGKLLYAKRIEPSELALFFDAQNACCPFVLHGVTTNYSVGLLPREAERFAPLPIKKLTDVKDDVFKVTVYGAPPKFSHSVRLRTHWEGGETASAQYVNAFANKGTALSDLQTRLMLTKFDTACIGDSDNDVVMLKGAKYSFSVGNRRQTVVEAANFKTDTAQAALELILTEM